MNRRRVNIKLVAFAIISLAATALLLIRFGGLSEMLNPPYVVRAHFAQSGGIFVRAEVDLLGNSVGTVRALALDTNGNVVATLAIKNGVSIPADVVASVANKSAIGEQYIELTPKTFTGLQLTDGAVIPISHTSTPLPVEQLLGNLNALAASVPRPALTSTLLELAGGFGGTAPDVAHLIDQSNELIRTAQANLHDQIELIDTTSAVLDTQVAQGPQIGALSAQTAGLTDELRRLVPTFVGIIDGGSSAGSQLSGFLADNHDALPALLDNLNDVTRVATHRQQQLRKTLATLPWGLQGVLDAIRYCDQNDQRTGLPVASTCQYDSQGRPKYSLRFALQLPEKPAISAPYQACVRGYEATRRYSPNGAPADGKGPQEPPNLAPNNNAACTSRPTDPDTPNVRGAQNVQHQDGG